MEKTLEKFKKLIEVMKRLRAPGGCPWDRKQTFDSLRPHIIEEAYELADAIERRDEPGQGTAHIIEECGDLLLQVVFIGTIAEETGEFSIGDIPEAISNKLIRRHPHIFSDGRAMSPEEALANWEEIKKKERAGQKTDTSVLSGVPRSMPPFVKAFRIQQKAASVGFDWEKEDNTAIMDKIGEELGEVREAVKNADRGEIAGELGDLMFAVINLSRRLGIEPGDALSKTNAKFERRFRFIENEIERSGRKWTDVTLGEMEEIWERSKSNVL